MTSDGYQCDMSRDAVAVLLADHTELDRLFERVSEVGEDRAQVLRRLASRLSAHVAMEQELLVPMVKDNLDSGEEMADCLSSYHDAVGRLLVLIDRRKINSPDMAELMTELLELTRHHISHANVTVLPAMRRGYPPDKLNSLGQAMDSDERSLLTHPHPHLPHRGPIGTVLRKIASTVDRKRDGSADLNRGAD